MPGALVLRDVHRPPSPPLWPLAPGWWLLIVAVLVIAAALTWWRVHRRRRRGSALAMFDNALDADATPVQRLAQASELLRRAARRVRADADRLDGGVWLAFLDTPRTRFVDGPGRLLLEGPFRPGVDARDADAALHLARLRFVELMERRR